MNSCKAVFFWLIVIGATCLSGAALAEENAWDTSKLGVSNDWFEKGTNSKNKNAPTVRIKKLTECRECQAQADKLQALLDAWYLAEYDAGTQLKNTGMHNDTKEGSAQQNAGKAMQAEASAGLGGLTTSEIGKKAKEAAKKPDPSIPQDPAQLGAAIKAAAAALQKCLDDCHKKTPGPTPEPGPTPTPAQPEGPKEKQDVNETKPDHVIELDFIVNRGAKVTGKEIDDALKKINEAFAKSGVGFARKTLTPVDNKDIPQTPKHGDAENQASDEQKNVAKEAQKIEKGLPAPHGAIPVKVVENFQDPDRPGYSKISGIQIGDVVLIADPSHVESNSFGQDNFSHVLAHELGHVLGLEHETLASDKGYKGQEGGRYIPPNIMANGSEHGGGPGEFTQDQIDVIKKHAKRFYTETTATPGTGGGSGGHTTKRPKKPRKHAKRGISEDDPRYMENYQPRSSTKSHKHGTGSDEGQPSETAPPDEGPRDQPDRNPDAPMQNPYNETNPEIPMPH
jgi:hypothetical protein